MKAYHVICIATCATGLSVLHSTAAFGQNANDGFDPNANNRVDLIAVQPDGKVVVAGIFSVVGGTNQTGLARLNPDGSVDTSFRPPQIFGGFAPVRAVAHQEDGRIIIAGYFRTPAPFSRTNIARLMPDGAVDTNFVADTDNTTTSVLLMGDGKILVGGFFRNVNGQPRQGIVRLESDGRIETNFTVTANQGVQAMLRQPDGRVVLGGQFTRFGDQPRNNLARLNSDGTVDAGFDPGNILDPGPDDGVHTLAIQPDGRILAAGYLFKTNELGRRTLLRFFPDGTWDSVFPTITGGVRTVCVEMDSQILVAGVFQTLLGEPRSQIARLLPAGSLSPSFTPLIAGGAGILDVSVQADGKIIVCGGFTNIAGHARNRIARFHRDGSVDATFNPPARAHVYVVALQPDDRVVVAGQVGPNSPNRLHPDGSRDTNFNYIAQGQGIWSAIVQTNGILVGGEFSSLGGQIARNLAFIRQDGTLDTNFVQVQGRIHCMDVYPEGRLLLGGDISVGPSGSNRLGIARINLDGTLDQALPNLGGVRCVAIHPITGKILVGGDLQVLGGQLRAGIVQIHENGNFDESFTFPASDAPRCFAFQSDGSILVGGGFTELDGQPVRKVARITTNGVIDTTFSPGPPTSFGLVYSMVVQADGKIIVSGIFHEMGGQPRTNIARLNPDGTLDAVFHVAASGFIDGLALQPDGKLLVGGDFNSIAGQPRTSLARLALGESAFQKLTADRTGTVLWQRTGVAPEVEDVTFEFSIDATHYTFPGRATRNSAGWEFAAPSFPAGTNFQVRARGRTRGGYYNGSRGLIESVAQFYFVPSPSLTLSTAPAPTSIAFNNPGHHYYTVFGTTNLAPPVLWEPLGSPTNQASGVYYFTDLQSTNYSTRFYRLLSQ